MFRIFVIICLIICFESLKSQISNENILIELVGNSPGEILNSDIDNDGDLDIIYTNHLGVVWLENKENIEFAEEQMLIDIIRITSISISDMDNDSKLDLIVGTYSNIILFSNLVNGSFLEITELHQFLNQGFLPGNYFEFYRIMTKDIDKDGYTDLIYNDPNEKKMVWQKNLESNSFSSQKIISNESNNNWRIPFQIIDIDNDSYLDIIMHHEIERNISWYRNMAGEFSTEALEIHSDVQIWRNLNVKDLDSDGDLDVIGWSTGLSNLDWYDNDGFINFQKQTIFPNIEYFRIVHVEDIDDDSDSDIFYIYIDSENGTKNLAWLENINGKFSKEPCNIAVISPLGQSAVNVYSIHGFDVNFDGKKEVILAIDGSSINHKIIYFEDFNCASTVTSSNDLNLEKPIMLHPNPFEDYIVLEKGLNIEKKIKILIYDSTGRHIKDEVILGQNQLINTTHLSKGMYFYQITDEIGNRLTNGKIIRN